MVFVCCRPAEHEIPARVDRAYTGTNVLAGRVQFGGRPDRVRSGNDFGRIERPRPIAIHCGMDRIPSATAVCFFLEDYLKTFSGECSVVHSVQYVVNLFFTYSLLIVKYMFGAWPNKMHVAAKKCLSMSYFGKGNVTTAFRAKNRRNERIINAFTQHGLYEIYFYSFVINGIDGYYKFPM